MNGRPTNGSLNKSLDSRFIVCNIDISIFLLHKHLNIVINEHLTFRLLFGGRVTHGYVQKYGLRQGTYCTVSIGSRLEDGCSGSLNTITKVSNHKSGIGGTKKLLTLRALGEKSRKIR